MIFGNIVLWGCDISALLGATGVVRNCRRVGQKARLRGEGYKYRKKTSKMT